MQPESLAPNNERVPPSPHLALKSNFKGRKVHNKAAVEVISNPTYAIGMYTF
jgi:hypothetical protein